MYMSIGKTVTFVLVFSSSKTYQSHRKRKTWTKNTRKVCKFSSLHCVTVFYLIVDILKQQRNNFVQHNIVNLLFIRSFEIFIV